MGRLTRGAWLSNWTAVELVDSSSKLFLSPTEDYDGEKETDHQASHFLYCWLIQASILTREL